MWRRRARVLAAAVLASTLPLSVGCQAPMQTPPGVVQGDLGQARAAVAERLSQDPGDRRYLLDRMRLAVLTLADGYAESAGVVLADLYDLLRTQGVNRDRTVASVVLNEDLKLWKGEPFEQALVLAYYAMQQAELGSWDNARAAANNALFYLRDFGEDEQGQRLDTYAIARRSLLYERAIDEGLSEEEARAQAGYLDHGYVAVPSNFTLGYLLAGVANQQLGRPEEASDHFTRVVEIDGGLEPLVEAFRGGAYNTVLIVGWGLGPEKVGYGPDRALARFDPRHPSDDAVLRVSVGGGDPLPYRVVTDVNAMAADHMWNNLEDVRIAKSTLGSVLLAGGSYAAVIGAGADSEEAVYAGLGAIALGAFLKAGAHVDTRHLDVLAQRYYAVPLNLTDPAQTVTLVVEGRPASRLVLGDLGPPPAPDAPARLRYIRLVSVTSPGASPPEWATRGQTVHPNPHHAAPLPEAPALPPADLPYLLGGRDVRPPSAVVMRDYQRAGYLPGRTTEELREWYRLEGVALSREAQGGYAGRHLLEGGDSLVAPLPGTTGYARLFQQLHPPYAPATRTVRQLAARIEPATPPAAATTASTPSPDERTTP